MPTAHLRLWRGDDAGAYVQYDVDYEDGMVVLDVVHRLQAEQANDLAVRWNCKAGKCGSCSVELNGRPRLQCMTRMEEFTAGTSADTSADTGERPSAAQDSLKGPPVEPEEGDGETQEVEQYTKAGARVPRTFARRTHPLTASLGAPARTIWSAADQSRGTRQ